MPIVVVSFTRSTKSPGSSKGSEPRISRTAQRNVVNTSSSTRVFQVCETCIMTNSMFVTQGMGEW